MSHPDRLSRHRGMRIAVVGGTGTLGRYVVENLSERGHEVRVLSRRSARYPVDLTTGAGLTAALAGVEVVVDAVNDASGKHATQTLVDGSRRLLDAERDAGVRHHVCVSIVGCERVPLGYFRAKAAQERVVENGPVPWTIVRATQFHELLAGALRAGARWKVLPVPHVRLQTVAARDVAAVVADVADRPPTTAARPATGASHPGTMAGQLATGAGRPATGTRVEVGGPAVADVRDLARQWRALTGARVALLPVPLPGRIGRELRAGALTAAAPDVRGGTGFAEWLRDGAGA